MSLMNINIGLLAYADGPSSNSPSLRLADLKWSMMGLPTENFRNVPLYLAPGETQTIATTSRPLSFNGSTSFVVSQSEPGIMRITGNFGQRTARASGDVTTQWTLTRQGDLFTASTVGGAAPTFSSIQVGDSASFSSAFQTYNQGEFLIVAKTPTSFSFLNSIGNEEIIAGKITVYSPGPVQPGDVLDLTSTQFNYLNRANTSILRVTSDFIEVAALTVIPETVTGVTGGLFIYPSSYQWLFVAVDRKVIVGLNGEAPTNNEIAPYVEGDLIKNPGIMMKRGKVFEVQLTNPGLKSVQGFIILAD